MASSSSSLFTLSQNNLQSLYFPFFFKPASQKRVIFPEFSYSSRNARNLFDGIIVRYATCDCIVRRASNPELENTTYLGEKSEKLEETAPEVKHQKKRKNPANGVNKKAESWLQITEKMIDLITKKRIKDANIAKSKRDKEAAKFTSALDMCSKKGDFETAISLYDFSLENKIKLKEYHYNVLLYLCSSASIGSIHPCKSGTNNTNPNPNNPKQSILISEELRDYARNRGFEIFEKMCLERVEITESPLTSVSRMAMSIGNGDLAFNIVKKMKCFNITPKLRSYEPALRTFCENKNLKKAFEVEAHMVKNGIIAQEPELFLLLKLSVEKKRYDKVYYLLHKLRTNVRQVSLQTSRLIETWFKSLEASRRGGERKCEEREGFVAGVKWEISRTEIDAYGTCLSCRERLETVDLDRYENERFRVLVSDFALMSEKHDSFVNFQEWLEINGPFEAIIDAANVGLFSHNNFSLNQVNVLIRALQRKLGTKKWPLIILHNKRVFGQNGKDIVNFWKKANAIYVTPTNSNDDWYWLYAAVNCKSLIVTNDEMRYNMFNLLGNDFFPKWKEQHQVRFSYIHGKFEFQMPPLYSVVIQESKRGDWHIPIGEVRGSEHKLERKRTWLCVRRNYLSKQIKKNV